MTIFQIDDDVRTRHAIHTQSMKKVKWNEFLWVFKSIMLCYFLSVQSKVEPQPTAGEAGRQDPETANGQQHGPARGARHPVPAHRPHYQVGC